MGVRGRCPRSHGELLVDLLPRVFQPFMTCHSFICSFIHSTTLSEHGDDLPWKSSHAVGDRPGDHCSLPSLSSSSWGQLPAQDNQGLSDAARASPHMHRTRFHPQKHLWGAHSPIWWILPAVATRHLLGHITVPYGPMKSLLGLSLSILQRGR